jgi:Protein of unknown function (DUF1573)
VNKRIVIWITAVAALGGVDAHSAQTNSASGLPAAPRIQLAETTFHFGKVTAGQVVRHDFLFTNVGSAVLTIKEVRSGCGCISADNWDKTVEPGKTGKIPLQFNSAAFHGTTSKSLAVLCNDPAQASVLLTVKGTVWNPIQVTPASALFNLSSEKLTNETRVLRIVNNMEEPIELFDPNCTNRSFRAQVKTLRIGKEFELRITAVPPYNSVPLTAPVTLRTSSPQVPVIQVNAYLMLQIPVVKPEQIVLPPGPLTNAVHSMVTIRSSGTNGLNLSDARLNVPAGVVHTREIQPGRFFTITVDFPVGFQVEPGRTVELTAQSNHPRLPLVRIPVVHAQPTAPAVTHDASGGIQLTPPKAVLPATARE